MRVCSQSVSHICQTSGYSRAMSAKCMPSQSPKWNSWRELSVMIGRSSPNTRVAVSTARLSGLEKMASTSRALTRSLKAAACWRP